MKNILIAVEGIDGTGKTTNAKMLANRIEAMYYKTPAPIFDDVRNIFNECGDVVAKYLFYLATLKLASSSIKEILEKRSVVVDRWLNTTICYHFLAGAKVDAVNTDKVVLSDEHTAFEWLDIINAIERVEKENNKRVVGMFELTKG